MDNESKTDAAASSPAMGSEAEYAAAYFRRQIDEARRYVEDNFIDCGCTPTSFIYGCRHKRRALLAILAKPPNK